MVIELIRGSTTSVASISNLIGCKIHLYDNWQLRAFNYFTWLFDCNWIYDIRWFLLYVRTSGQGWPFSQYSNIFFSENTWPTEVYLIWIIYWPRQPKQSRGPGQITKICFLSYARFNFLKSTYAETTGQWPRVLVSFTRPSIQMLVLHSLILGSHWPGWPFKKTMRLIVRRVFQVLMVIGY